MAKSTTGELHGYHPFSPQGTSEACAVEHDPQATSSVDDNTAILKEPNLRERARRIAVVLGNPENIENVLAYLRDEDH